MRSVPTAKLVWLVAAVLVAAAGCGSDFEDAPLQLADADVAVVGIAEPVYREADRAPGDWDRSTEASFLPRWTFAVTAVEVGTSRVDFEFTANGETIDVYAVTFDVVEDACAVVSNQSTCGR